VSAIRRLRANQRLNRALSIAWSQSGLLMLALTKSPPLACDSSCCTQAGCSLTQRLSRTHGAPVSLFAISTMFSETLCHPSDRQGLLGYLSQLHIVAAPLTPQAPGLGRRRVVSPLLVASVPTSFPWRRPLALRQHHHASRRSPWPQSWQCCLRCVWPSAFDRFGSRGSRRAAATRLFRRFPTSTKRAAGPASAGERRPLARRQGHD
jgi:hypothetical protein